VAAVDHTRDAWITVPKTIQKSYASATNLSVQRMARLLIVEDDELSRDIATRWLTRHGYRNVDSAASGAEGLAACTDDPPDILILDHALPDLSGMAIAEYLCLNFRREERPWIVLFTAAADSTIARLMSTGYFDDLLRKPCVGEDYIAALARAHAGLRERRKLAAKNAMLVNASSSSTSLHL
jgi:CheY-like chemotaxis protein